MLGRTKKSTRVSKETLEALSEALNEIESYFELNGFSRNRGEINQPSDSTANNENQNYSDDESSEEETGDVVSFDREELEVAIGVFASELVRAEVLAKPKPRKAPTMKQIFINIFGKKHKIIKLVEGFEEHTEGYFDAIQYDEMRAAFGMMLEIREVVSDELSQYAQR